MEKFCAITPTRGDRPQFLEHCKMQMKRQLMQPGDHFIIDYKPKGDIPDLTQRIRRGIQLAIDKGYDIVYIIEDDDYYPNDYFEKMQMKGSESFIGIEQTMYYNIVNNRYSVLKHGYRSSLFCTGFRISSLKQFAWPDNLELSLDLALWKFAKWCNVRFVNIHNFNPIGIKHGIGLCAGTAHNTNFPYENEDLNKAMLKQSIRKESFDFYNNILNEK
jgi:hypothetical protein